MTDVPPPYPPPPGRVSAPGQPGDPNQMAGTPPSSALSPGRMGTPSRYEWRRLLSLVGVIVLLAVCGIGMLVYVGYNIGPTALAVGSCAALIPVPVLVFCFLWLDRYDPEPIRVLLLCLGWGACVATAVALAVNTGAEVLFKHLGLSSTLVAVLVAPFIEESMKATLPFILFLRRRRHRTFSSMVDGIVYCGLSATGFAMVENILYLGGYGYQAGANRAGAAGAIAGLVSVFIGRIFFSAFAHPLFTSMTGLGLGLAARTSDRRIRVLAPLAGWLTAMILHGSWNEMSVLAAETNKPVILLYGYFSVMMPIFLGMVGFALWLRSYEGRITQRILPEYVRTGWLSPPEVASLATIGRRQSARYWAKRVAGDPGAQAMRGYQFVATRLALLRDGLRRGLVAGNGGVAGALYEERELLTALTWYRAAFTGRDPRMPRAVWDGVGYQVTFPDGVVRGLAAPPDQPVVPVPVLLAPYPYPYR